MVPIAGIVYAHSVDGGLTFSTPTNLSSTPNCPSQFPVVAASGPNVFVAWQEINNGAEIVLARSTDGGATFSSPINVSNTPTGSGAPNITVDGVGGVFIVGEMISSAPGRRCCVDRPTMD